MNYRIIKACIVIAITGSAGICSGQGTSSTPTQTVLTADSLASGNSKDVLTSFFQLAFNQLTGPNKQLNFSSNPFAVMLKSDSGLALDYNYYKYRALRKTNFNFGLKLDSSYRFNGFSSGVKYALINQRDSTTSKLLFRNLDADELGKEADQLQNLLVAHAKTIPAVDDEKNFLKMIHDFYWADTPFNKLDAAIQNEVKDIVHANKATFPKLLDLIDNKPTSNLRKEEEQVFQSLKNAIKNDLLWTVGVSDTTYKDQFFFSNIVLGTELVKGLGANKPGSNFEFDLNAALHLLDDSSTKARNLKRALFTFEPGFNWVIRNKGNDHSWLEFQLSGSYSRNLTTLYVNEKRDSLSFNGTLRIRIINDIWIPLEFKYDPRSGNVFGFINVKFNFSTLGGLVNASKSAAKQN